MLYGTANTDDLLVFLRIAAFLESGESLSSAAKRMGVSPSVLSTLMDRVESAFPRQQLFIRRTGAGGGTFLTELGRQALKSTLTGFDELRQKQSRFDVACSQTLLDVVGPALSEAIPNDGRADVHVRLNVSTRFRFRDLLHGIREGNTHVAFVYGVGERLKEHAGIKTTLMPEKFDLVFVSHDHKVIDKINDRLRSVGDSGDERCRVEAAAKAFGDLRLVMLDREAQPFSECFYREDVSEPLLVDTYDASLAVIRAKVADLSLVPALYSSLIRMRELGELFFSEPVGKIPILMLHRQVPEMVRTIEEVASKVESRLTRAATRPSESLSQMYPLPHKIDEYLSLRYGYYVDGDRHELGNAVSPPFAWRSEEIVWTSSFVPGMAVLEGVMRNCHGDSFSINAEAFPPQEPATFVVRAKKKGTRAGEDWSSVTGFVSVFSFCLLKPLRLVGTWVSAAGGPPSVFATVLSADPLSRADLQQIQENTQPRVFLSSNKFIDEIPG